MAMLEGKRALITGIASERSIAYGIAEAMHREGAELGLTYQNEKLQGRVEKVAEKLNATFTTPLDVATDAAIDSAMEAVGQHWSEFDILVHSVAFAPREALQGEFLQNTSREDFNIAHEISAYSLIALGRAARPLMQGRNGAILTLSYLGAERAMPSYNVMGVAKAALESAVRYMAESLGPEGTRVNAISAGPIKTLAAAGIKDMRTFLNVVERTAPLRRNVTIEEVGNAAAFMCSDLASAITGEVTYVDCGYSITGMAREAE